MPHMMPHYVHATMWTLTKPNGDSELYDDLHTACFLIERDPEFGNGESYTIECSVGWWARLSADGYLDATEWGGPFPGRDEARTYIEDTYEVDPDSGEPLEEYADPWQPQPIISPLVPEETA